MEKNGTRLVAKYYAQEANFVTKEAQLLFERNVFAKTSHNLSAEVLVFDRYVIVYKSMGSLIAYVVGSSEENELMLLACLTTFRDVMDALLRGRVDKISMLENLDYVLLTLDELVDDGYVWCGSICDG